MKYLGHSIYSSPIGNIDLLMDGHKAAVPEFFRQPGPVCTRC